MAAGAAAARNRDCRGQRVTGAGRPPGFRLRGGTGGGTGPRPASPPCSRLEGVAAGWPGASRRSLDLARAPRPSGSLRGRRGTPRAAPRASDRFRRSRRAARPIAVEWIFAPGTVPPRLAAAGPAAVPAPRPAPRSAARPAPAPREVHQREVGARGRRARSSAVATREPAPDGSVPASPSGQRRARPRWSSAPGALGRPHPLAARRPPLTGGAASPPPSSRTPGPPPGAAITQMTTVERGLSRP